MARPFKPYQTTYNGIIPGLYRGTDKRWRIIETGERFREENERKAIRRFYETMAKLHPVDVQIQAVVYQGDPKADTDLIQFLNASGVDLTEGVHTIDAAARTITATLPAPREILIPWLQSMIDEKPEQLATMIGRPELAKLADLPERQAPLKLSAIIETYRIHSAGKDASKTLAIKCLTRLITFIDPVRQLTLADLTTERLLAFRSKMETEIVGTNTRLGVYAKIKTVIGFGRKMGMNAAQIAKALDNCKVLWTAEQPPAPQPKPISREDYHRLLNAATGRNSKWRLWLLLGLNCAMYLSEVSLIKWDEVNMTNATFAAIRVKTEKHRIPRAATLWAETMEEIKTLSRTASPYLFTSPTGTHYQANGLVNQFQKFAAKAGVTGVTFSHLRDGAYTAAIRSAPEATARVLAGHVAPGLEDSYVLRSPEIVRPACEAVYSHYLAAPAEVAGKIIAA